MIPFDLERAKKGVPMRTRHGHTAKFIAHLQGGQPAPLVVEINKSILNHEHKHVANESVENYFLNGKYDGVHNSPLDLFMEY